MISKEVDDFLARARVKSAFIVVDRPYSVSSYEEGDLRYIIGYLWHDNTVLVSESVYVKGMEASRKTFGFGEKDTLRLLSNLWYSRN